MNVLPHVQINAVENSSLNLNIKLFNKSELAFYTWIKVPNDIAKRLCLRGVIESGSEDFLDYGSNIQREGCSPWYRFNTSILNTQVGHHEYKMCFQDTCSDNMIDLYFAYYIQDDNPDKPYVYMNDI